LKGFYKFPNGVSGVTKVTKPVFVFHGNIAVVHYVADEHDIFYENQVHTTYGTSNTCQNRYIVDDAVYAKLRNTSIAAGD